MLICLSCSVQSAPAAQPTAAGNPESTSSTSPQFLYMKRLHDRIKDVKVKVDPEEGIKDERTSGTLIATSIEAASDISGTGEFINKYVHCTCKHATILYSSQYMMLCEVGMLCKTPAINFCLHTISITFADYITLKA